MALFRMKPWYRKRVKELSYYGTITGLTWGKYNLAAASTSDHAVFGGGVGMGYAGHNAYSDANIIDSYNKSLTRTNAGSALIVSRIQLAAASAGDYVLFAGGYNDNDYSYPSSYRSDVDAYNKSLVRSNPSYLNYSCKQLAGLSFGDYALFAGGVYIDSRGYTNVISDVNRYNSSLTKQNISSLYDSCRDLAATSIGDYALFAGGYHDKKYNYESEYSLSDVTAYNKSFTKSIPTGLSVARYALLAASNKYALFAGGYNSYTVDAYDSSLTRTNPTDLSVYRYTGAATSIGDYALFAAGQLSGNSSNGYNPISISTVDAYDSSLTRTNPTDLVLGRYSLAATSIGDYALFAGGSYFQSSHKYADTIDVYQVA